MAQPIPRRLLPHSATYTPFLGMVASKKTYGTPAALSFVRLVPVKQNAITSLGDMKNDRFTLYYDCANSLPAGISFKAGDLVEFVGSTATVRAVAPIYADSPSVHHVEVQLV